MLKIKLQIRRLGLSLINSQAREIAYIFIKNFKLSHQLWLKNKKISIKAKSLQIDNQLVRQNDAIIFKKQMNERSRIFVLKIHM